MSPSIVRMSLGLMVLLTSAAVSSEPVADRAAPMAPGKVQLHGWLGGRIDASAQHRLMKVDLEERIRPFRTPSEKEGWSGEHIGKWLHAASLAWLYNRDPVLKQRLDSAAAGLIAAQGPDGYLGTYSKENRWGGWDVWTHKYNLIGLLAYYDASGDARAVAAARKIGDLLVDTFGEGKRDLIASGTHVGMAATSALEPMVLLARATGEPRYLEFCRYIVRSYDQPNGPQIVASLTKTGRVDQTANGKAYEMMSNLVGLCELYRQTGDETLLVACRKAHDDIAANQMYLTGGTSLGEHFQKPHHLPNTGAVSENCAQVTWLQLAIQLLRITGDSKYADTIERIAYNHLLAGQKPEGEALCYFTPLQGKKPFDKGTNCCTSSGPRGIALLPTVAYTRTRQGIAINLFEPSTLKTDIQVMFNRNEGPVPTNPNGETPLPWLGVKLVQETSFPVGNLVNVAVETSRPAEFTLSIRIPGWCKQAKMSVNGQPSDAPAKPGTYCALRRTWKTGDRLSVEFDMPALLVRGTGTNEGMMAAQRGPLVLAFDGRLAPGVLAGAVSPAAERDGTVKAEPVKDPQGIAAHAFRIEGLVRAGSGEAAELKRVPLVLTSFAEAGRTGSTYAVWFPSPERLKRAALSPFLGAKESQSRPGNVEGSIADGDSSTFRVTFDRRPQAEAWFAVERDRPIEINAVVYTHGKSFHDGGWFDASKGKPRIQVKKTAGKWEDVATLDDYPATTSTDNKGLTDGREFVARFPPVSALAIRVIGIPAGGDNPKQAFASCAELRGMRQEGK